MAVKTQLTQHDFDYILSQYNLGTCTQFEPISQGTVQTNYLIITTQGKSVFRYYENRARESVLFESELLTYLTAMHYPCPAPIPNRHGIRVGTYQRKPFVIFEFLEGHHIQQPTGDHLQQLIQKVAELGILTRDYRPQYWFYRQNYDIEHCRKLAMGKADKLGTQDAHEKFTWLDFQLSSLHLPETLPKGVCHCDFHFSNILFHDDQFVGLIDFDDANFTYVVFDLINLIDYWAWPPQSDFLDLAAARRITQAYRAHRSLEAIEQHHLFDVHKLGILFDSIWFFTRGSADDFYEMRKIEYLDTLGRQRYADALFSM
jgi:Ser/Thr protein kinase RdoA (MazF antagonist)